MSRSSEPPPCAAVRSWRIVRPLQSRLGHWPQVMSLNSSSSAQSQQRSATGAHHHGRKPRHHHNQSLHHHGRPRVDSASSRKQATTLPRIRSLQKASSTSSTSGSSSGEEHQPLTDVKGHHNLNNNNSTKQLNQESTMHKSVTIVTTAQRSNSLDYLNFEEKRQLIASSLSLSELLHCGPAAVKEAAANGEWFSET